MKYYIYNELANNGTKPKLPDDANIIRAVGLDYPEFFKQLQPEDEVVMVGGDGTLNYLVNHVDCDRIKNKIWYFAAGTGNDFLKDISGKLNEEILINDYLKHLPTIEVNGFKSKFINGIGYGIDGYCCEEADKIKGKNPAAKLNYTSIAVKGILFKFRPRSAQVIVDGKGFEYKNVWIAATMKGRYYGGGMNIAPDQNRNSDTLTVVVYMHPWNLVALANFPKVFNGTHVELKKIVKIKQGKRINVKFAKPCGLQIDGETVHNVSEYSIIY